MQGLGIEGMAVRKRGAGMVPFGAFILACGASSQVDAIGQNGLYSRSGMRRKISHGYEKSGEPQEA